MPLRALAIELYKAQQKVHKLQDQLEQASLTEKDQLRRELRTAQASLDQLRRLVDARKEPSPYSHRRQ